MSAQDIIEAFEATPRAQRGPFSAKQLIGISASTKVASSWRTWALHGLIWYAQKGDPELGKDPITWLRRHMERIGTDAVTVEVLRAFRKAATDNQNRHWASRLLDAKNGVQRQKPKPQKTATAEPTMAPVTTGPEGISAVATTDFGIERPKTRKVKKSVVEAAAAIDTVVTKARKAKASPKKKVEAVAASAKPAAKVTLNGFDGLSAALAARQSSEPAQAAA